MANPISFRLLGLRLKKRDVFYQAVGLGLTSFGSLFKSSISKYSN
jgi:hypothetical protein